MKIKLILLFIAASFIILFQFLKSPDIIIKNDLNGNIVPLQYFKESITKNHTFPLWNPYINQGIPTTADPLYGIYNPIISIPILLFEYKDAIKIIYFVSILLAMITMYLLVKEYKIRDSISILIAINYCSGTYLISKITAGHLEKIVSFAFMPLLILTVIKLIRRKKLKWAGTVGLILSLILFTGDIYNALYSLYTLLAILVFYLFKDKKISLLIFISIISFLLFSSIKLFPMIELQQYITKIKEPFVGNLNFLSIFYYLFFPFSSFYKTFLPTENFLSNAFGWWENFAFIGPFSFLGLVYLFTNKISKYKTEKKLFILLIVLFTLMSMPGENLNPLKFIISNFSILQYFHVPSRILLLFSIVVLLFFGLYAEKLHNKKYIFFLLLINLVITFCFSQYIFNKNQFDKLDKNYSTVLKHIKQNNLNNYPTVHYNSQGDLPQDIALNNKILLLQSNYGLFLKGSLGEKYNFKGNNTYQDILPGLIISDSKIELKNYALEKNFNKIYLYKNTNTLSFATFDNKPTSFTLKPNSIIINVNSNKPGILKLLESNYPGWKVFKNGQEINLEKSRFLTITTSPGENKYEFKFISKSFYLGLAISFISLILFIAYLAKVNKLFLYLNNRRIISKKWFQ